LLVRALGVAAMVAVALQRATRHRRAVRGGSETRPFWPEVPRRPDQLDQREGLEQLEP
jgi:hypothetical protein